MSRVLHHLKLVRCVLRHNHRLHHLWWALRTLAAREPAKAQSPQRLSSISGVRSVNLCGGKNPGCTLAETGVLTRPSADRIPVAREERRANIISFRTTFQPSFSLSSVPANDTLFSWVLVGRNGGVVGRINQDMKRPAEHLPRHQQHASAPASSIQFKRSIAFTFESWKKRARYGGQRHSGVCEKTEH